jgi:hypothetical protein
VKRQQTRLKKLEQKVGPVERQFISWGDRPWTEEQKAEAIRKDPECLLFWPTLVETFPLLPRHSGALPKNGEGGDQTEELSNNVQ